MKIEKNENGKRKKRNIAKRAEVVMMNEIISEREEMMTTENTDIKNDISEIQYNRNNLINKSV
jgi:hypothetical protein